ncbi:MAG: hypothetical protein ACNFW9_00735 [Candidatus Kerfeldbacteria bacterium]
MNNSKKQIIWVAATVIILFLLLILAFAVYNYFMQEDVSLSNNSNVATNINNSNTNSLNINSNVDLKLSDGFLFFDKSVHDPSDYRISTSQLNHISAVGKITNITKLELQNSINSAGYNDGKIYYITKGNSSDINNAIGIYNIIDGKKEILISNDTEEWIMKIFIYDQKYIFYLQGPCISGGQEEWDKSKCNLYRYNLEEGDNELFIEDIYSQIDGIYLASLSFKSYNSNDGILEMGFNGGDAGVGAMAIYQLDLESKEINKIVSERYYSCEFECDEIDLENNKYYKLRDEFHKLQPCGEYTFGSFGYYTIYKDGIEVEGVEPWQIVKCFEPAEIEADTSDWLTYENKDNVFSLKYPNTFSLIQESENHLGEKNITMSTINTNSIYENTLGERSDAIFIYPSVAADFLDRLGHIGGVLSKEYFDSKEAKENVITKFQKIVEIDGRDGYQMINYELGETMYTIIANNDETFFVVVWHIGFEEEYYNDILKSITFN